MRSATGRFYLGCVAALGAGLIAHSCAVVASGSYGYQWLFVAMLAVISGLLSIRVASLDATLSISEAFVFTSVLFYGPAPGTLTAALDGLVISLSAKHRRVDRTMFNVAAPAISTWVAATLFYDVAGISPLTVAPATGSAIIAQLLLLVTVNFLMNASLTAFVMWFDTGVQPVAFVKAHGAHLSLNYCGSFGLVCLLVQQGTNVTFAATALVVPFLAMSYFAIKASGTRAEDANRHLTELNDLYVSTVETLAMAVDAKDQVTHGHIRRVQRRAVALAERLGISDEANLKAIEAAALLHDLGKLAIPDHILNKPGKLTPFEFEQMKAHARIGADILARVKFPYPVAPIVRHHHEAWDGSGYPDALSGEDIPLGARILAVVDCFDAVTSDRPYRRALGKDQASDILLTRRGTMYDPRVVDAFIELTRAEPIDNRDAAEQQQMSEMIHAFTKERGVSAAATAPRAEPEALRSLLENVAFGIGRDVEYVLFLYRPAADSLVASSVASVVTTNVLKLPLGEGISGWVGANRRSIINSEAALDLGGTATERETPLRSCAAIPITAGEQLLGVLTFYSTRSQAFTVAHAAGLECLAQLVALGLQRSLFAMPRSQESVVFRVPGLASFKRPA